MAYGYQCHPFQAEIFGSYRKSFLTYFTNAIAGLTKRRLTLLIQNVFL